MNRLNLPTLITPRQRLVALAAALVALAALLLSVPSLPSASASPPAERPADASCRAWGYATKSGSTVRFTWELYCSQRQWLLRPAPVVQRGSYTKYWSKRCYEAVSCRFTTTLKDPRGRQKYHLVWDSAANGTVAVAGGIHDGEQQACAPGDPGGIYCQRAVRYF